MGHACDLNVKPGSGASMSEALRRGAPMSEVLRSGASMSEMVNSRIAWRQVAAWKHGIVLRWRLQTCLAAAVYAGSLYIAMRALHAGQSSGPSTALPSAKLHAILSGLQLALAVAAAVADFSR